MEQRMGLEVAQKCASLVEALITKNLFEINNVAMEEECVDVSFKLKLALVGEATSVEAKMSFSKGKVKDEDSATVLKTI